MRYLIFNKPYGVLTQFTDQEGRSTLKDFIPIPQVYAVGRLDRDSEGLLLLTDDGPLKSRLIDPQFGHPRTYWVQVEGIPDDSQLAPLRQGVTIQSQPTRPAEVQILSPDPQVPPRDPPIRERRAIPTCWLQITLREGRNRQVRRMTAAVGFPTLRLVRVGLGSLQLKDLSPGQWRDLTAAELQDLQQLCALAPISKPRKRRISTPRSRR